jgi:hypothetical protein
MSSNLRGAGDWHRLAAPSVAQIPFVASARLVPPGCVSHAGEANSPGELAVGSAGEIDKNGESAMICPRRSLAVGAIVAGVLLAACGKSEPPPPPKTEPPKALAPAINESMKMLAAEVYVYAYPLVLMDVTKQVMTAKVQINAFQHKRSFPEASSADVVSPNADVLDSRAWLDLKKEPIILSVPDTRGRYYEMQMLDAWTNVFGSPGKRTTGTKKTEFAITGPNWKGDLPKGVEQEIKSPTEMVWLIGRTETNGKADYAAVAKIQDQYKLTPLSHWGKSTGKATAASAAAPAGVDVKTAPTEQVAKMSAQTFFTRFAMLLPGNPPAKDDAPVVERIKKLGIIAGQPFDTAKLEAAATKSVDEGINSAREAIAAAARGSIGDIKNGWTIYLDLGRYGTNYGKRAVIALVALGATAPEDAISPSTRFDADGKPLNGASKYVLHFDKGKTPPVDGFWSLTMYNDKQFFVANPIDRHAIGDRDKLQFNPGGTLDVYLQNESPGKDKESNWLPAPKGSFNLILRLYWPRQEVLDGRWAPPAVRRVS